MINREAAIIVTITAIMISIPVTYFSLAQAQGAPASSCDVLCATKKQMEQAKILKVGPAGANMTTGPKHYMIGSPAGANMTGSNMTGATKNTTAAAHSSSIPTTNPAGVRPNRL
jgi:hypothetical protein